MRHSLRFLALCSALDEASTFANVSMGGVELNPRVAQLIRFHPLLYPILDLILVLAAVAVDMILKDRVEDIWLVWVATGIGRLVCFALSIF